MRRLGTRNLGVGGENGSDWKGKLQAGSGGTRWGLAGQGYRWEVWGEVWKMGSDRKRGKREQTPHPPWNETEIHGGSDSSASTWGNPSAEGCCPFQCLCWPCPKQPDGCCEPGLLASLQRSARGRSEHPSSADDPCGHWCDAKVHFFYLQFQKSAQKLLKDITKIANSSSLKFRLFA